MTQYFNRQEQKSRRQHLRNEPTKAERLLWSRLKHSQLDGLKFRRQHGVGEYVIDLYCPEAKLAIEADGESHFDPESRAYDERRTAFLNSFGIHVLRFTNPQVYKELDWVIEQIWYVAKARLKVRPTGKHGLPFVLPNEAGRLNIGKGGRVPLINRDGDNSSTPLCPPLLRGEATDPPESPLGKGGGDDPLFGLPPWSPSPPLGKGGGS